MKKIFFRIESRELDLCEVSEFEIVGGSLMNKDEISMRVGKDTIVSCVYATHVDPNPAFVDLLIPLDRSLVLTEGTDVVFYPRSISIEAWDRMEDDRKTELEGFVDHLFGGQKKEDPKPGRWRRWRK